jgi:hypothetical protein
MMTDEQIIEVVTARKEGKNIQFRSFESKHLGWLRNDNPQWDFTAFEYRVIPESSKPREWVIAEITDGKDQYFGVKFPELKNRILVREVL